MKLLMGMGAALAFGVGLVAGQGKATRSVMRLVLQKQPARAGEL